MKKAKEKTSTPKHKNLFLRGNIWYIKRVENGRTLIQSTSTAEIKDALIERDRVLVPYSLRDEKEKAEVVLSRVSAIDKKLTAIENAIEATTIKATATPVLIKFFFFISLIFSAPPNTE